MVRENEIREGELSVEVPIGLGRTGERSENVPRVNPFFFGLCNTRLRSE